MSSLWISVRIFIKSVISRSQTPETTWEPKARFVSSLQVIYVVVSKINLLLQTDKVSDQEFLCCWFNDFIDFLHKYLIPNVNDWIYTLKGHPVILFGYFF